jgi:hypothetical protein
MSDSGCLAEPSYVLLLTHNGVKRAVIEISKKIPRCLFPDSFPHLVAYKLLLKKLRIMDIIRGGAPPPLPNNFKRPIWYQVSQLTYIMIK